MAKWTLSLSVIAIVISLISLYNSWKARKFEEKEKWKIKIAEELQMYSDIAYSNRWNWLPRDVGVNDPRYSEYTKVIQRFVSYLEFVDPEIQETYRYIVDKFNSGYKDSERAEVQKKYQEIIEYSKNKAIELGRQLRGV